MPDTPDLRRLDWKDLYPRLLLYAEGRLRRMVWLRELRGPIPGGHTADDFIQTAYLKFADGSRAWNPNLTAFQNFVGAISSVISNCAEGIENRIMIRADDNVIQIVRDGQLSPEEKIAYDLEVKELLDALPKEDGLIREMARQILINDIDNMRELAVALGVEQNVADAAKRRLRRHVAKYVAERPSSVFARIQPKASPRLNNARPDTTGVASNDR